MSVNKFKELEYRVKLKDAYLTLQMSSENYGGEGAFLVCGIIERNGEPLELRDFPRQTIDTHGGGKGLFVERGYFEEKVYLRREWIVHTPIKSEVGDIITLKHFQLYKL